MMRIAIDLQAAQSNSRFRGIGRYSLAFTKALIRNASTRHQIFVVLNGAFPDSILKIREELRGVLDQEHIKVWFSPMPVMECQAGTDQRRQIAERMREAYIASLNPDIIHICSLFEGYGDNSVTSIGQFDQSIPVSVSFYDLIPLLNPEDYLSDKYYSRYYHRKLSDLKSASLLLCISLYAKSEAEKYLEFPKDNIISVSSAAEDYFNAISPDIDSKSFFLENGIKENFILYTGGGDPRKNIIGLVEAYASLSNSLRERHQLVLAGRIDHNEKSALQRLMHRLQLKNNEVVFTDYVSEDELKLLYQTCYLFIFPSWHEGFGLPVLEAMKCGAPVIGSNTTSLPEVIGRTELMFDPKQISSIKERLEALLTNPDEIQFARQHSAVQAKLFSWDITAQKALIAMEALFASRPLPIIKEAQNSIVSDLLASIHSLREESKPLGQLEWMQVSACIAQNFPDPTRKNSIFLDISELVKRDAKTGIQRVVRSLLIELVNKPPEGFIVYPVYANQIELGYRHANRFMNHFLDRPSLDLNEDYPIQTAPGDIFFGLDLQPDIVDAQKQYLSAIHLNGTKVFFMVYDLLPIQLPYAFPPAAKSVHEQWLKEICKFDGVVCISNAVAQELAIWIREQGIKTKDHFTIDWFHLGADIENSSPSKGLPDRAEELIRQIKTRTSFIMIGTLEPRKGYEQTLFAFEQLWLENQNINLVIIGKNGWLMDEFAQRLSQHPERNHRLFWLDSISDEYLEQIYSASSCLIAASNNEGFGLPLIEAARRGVPIIARNIPVFKEVARDFAFYFDATSPLELKNAISEWLTLYQNGKHPPSQGMPWLTWQASAQSILKTLLN